MPNGGQKGERLGSDFAAISRAGPGRQRHDAQGVNHIQGTLGLSSWRALMEDGRRHMPQEGGGNAQAGWRR